jgi:2'-5' RNA ligase
MASESTAGEPLILTLAMDDASQERFDRLREAHFPPERNYLRAHLTLFHKLPGEQRPKIVSGLEEICRESEPMVLRATGLRFLGKGVAYNLVSPELEALRRALAEHWAPWLGPQDRQRIKPHVTIQNKVSPEEARRLHEELRGAFSPFEVVGEGLLLWRYLGGPWEPVDAFPFEGGRR